MPFDPTKPANNSPNSSAEMRAQLNGLKSLIDALVTVNAAQVDGVTTLPAGDPATVSVSVTGSTLHFTFSIPQGYSGAEGPQGVPGEVTLADLNNAVLNVLNQSSANSNGVGTLAIGISNPPTQSEVQQIANKVDELINALRR
jgi:hypothetical protein